MGRPPAERAPRWADVEVGRPAARRWWLLGMPMALVGLWLTGLVFANSVPVYVWDPAVRTWVFDPTVEMHYRSEGRATTRFGPHGQIAPDPSAPKGGGFPADAARRLTILGDSFVEALHVGDEEKMHRQFNALWRSAHPSRSAHAIAFGDSGATFRDYLDWIPRYERVVGTPTRYIIILHDSNDILAPESSRRTEPVAAGLRPMLRRYRLAPLWILVRDAQRTEWNLEIGPRATPPAAQPAPGRTEEQDREQWRGLLTDLASRTAARVHIVYIPPVPRLTAGRIEAEDRDADSMSRFGAACEHAGVSFSSVGEEFLAKHRKTGRFPRGFGNSAPGEGHLNVDGHRIVAEHLVALEEKLSAVHTP